jgi:hypothetical protein
MAAKALETLRVSEQKIAAAIEQKQVKVAETFREAAEEEGAYEEASTATDGKRLSTAGKNHQVHFGQSRSPKQQQLESSF